MIWKVLATEKMGSQPEVIRAAQLFAAEMIRGGQHPGDTVVVGAGDPAVWVEHEGEVVGVLGWQPYPDAGYAWIYMSFVEPTFRRHGVYRAMYEAVAADAKMRGLRYIEGMVCADNAPMIELKRRMGFELVRHTFHRRLG